MRYFHTSRYVIARSLSLRDQFLANVVATRYSDFHMCTPGDGNLTLPLQRSLVP